MLINFLSAWDDVLKEMSASPLQAGGRVQYYNGQWNWLWGYCLTLPFGILRIFKFFEVGEQCFKCDLHLYFASSKLWKSNGNGSHYMVGKCIEITCFIISDWCKRYWHLCERKIQNSRKVLNVEHLVIGSELSALNKFNQRHHKPCEQCDVIDSW